MHYLSIKFRVSTLLILISVLVILNLIVNKNFNFLNPQTNLVFYTLFFAIIMGLLLRESKFTTPTHSLSNSLALILALILFKKKEELLFYRANLWFFSILAVVSLVAIFIYEKDKPKRLFSEFVYRFSTFFGRASIAFSTVFIFTLFSFYANKPAQFMLLLSFWGLVLFLTSQNVLMYLQDHILTRKNTVLSEELGKIIEERFPGLITLLCYEKNAAREEDYCYIVRKKMLIYKIYKTMLVNDETYCKVALIKGLEVEQTALDKSVAANKLCLIGNKDKLKTFITDKSIIDSFKNYVGLIIEQTEINTIRFQVISNIKLEEGYILTTKVGDKEILYQIVNVSLSLDKLAEGAITDALIGVATQVGEWNPSKVRFEKHGWVPKLYSTLFLVDENYKISYKLGDNELVLGYIPNTRFPIIANIDTLVTHHTAVLGITGSGKTELAFTIIGKMQELKTKVFCIDFTGDYGDEFKEFSPEIISIAPGRIEELNQKLFDAETGDYGAGPQKRELDKFKKIIIPEIEEQIKKFIESDKYLGIFELSEISNTSAAIAITELYISSLFKYAKEHRDVKRKYCIVLEEAHTIIPEDKTMGVQDKFSKATISKICQIALQGRKYRIGLFVVAQRTANVTKTVLNQCNSIIVFSSFDKTGFDFMENYIGKDMISAIPNLKVLQAVVTGRAFKSGRPLIMNIPIKDKFKEN